MIVDPHRQARAPRAASGQRAVTLGLLLALAVPLTLAADPYYLVPDVPTDLGAQTWLPWDVVHNDNGSFSSPWSLPDGIAINALNYNSATDVLFSVAAAADLGGTVYEPRDVVRWNGVAFMMFFDGSAEGLPAEAVIDSILIDQADLVIGFAAVTTVGTETFEPADLVRVTAGTYSLYLDASATMPPIPAGTNVTAAAKSGSSTVLCFDVPTSLGPFTYHPGELVAWDGSGFTSLYVEPAWPASSRVHGLTVAPTSCNDGDGDGYGNPGNALCSAGPEDDCDDGDATVNPGAAEVGCDGIENDCDAGTPDVLDGDEDGFDCDVDCDDAEPAVNPGADEVGCDSIDNDCDAGTPDVLDGDEDGFDCDVDCDDAEPTVNPGADEVACDGVDNDCDAGTPDLADADSDTYACDVDCDDDNAGVNPGAPETVCDGVDNDCDAGTPDLVDVDRDTFTCDVDCNDNDSNVFPGAPEIGCDGVDNDCDPGTPDVFDGDGDGFHCSTDCDDGNADVNPSADEAGCDGVDNDCDPGTPDVLDGDADGFTCNFDCNDDDPDINPGEAEVACDGIDNDCVPGTPDLVDADEDGFDCSTDCNDDNGEVNPGAAEKGCDGVDNDCNPGTPDVFDGDADGFACDADCDDGNVDAWGTPGEVQQVLPTDDGRTLVWSAPADPGGNPGTLVYDVLRSTDPADFLTDTTCVLSDTSQTSVDDPDDPPPTVLYFYLMRAQNGCPAAEGPLGLQSGGAPRVGRACP